MPAFENQATMSYNDTIINSNTTIGQIFQTPQVTKNAVSGTYTPVEIVTYVISIINPGNSDLEDISVSDNLGLYTFEEETYVPLSYVDGSARLYINGVLQEALEVNAGTELVFSQINIPANENALLIYEAVANQFASPEAGSSITNEVSISGIDSECFDDVVADETIQVEERPELIITKFVDPNCVSEGDTLTYTFVIQNTGNSPADETENIIVTDTFDPALNDITVTFNDEEWSEPENYTYSEATGEFATVEGQITVPAATFTRDEETGAWITTPGVSILTISGTV
ncbi:MAG: DUF11 domain-containing protein [Ruminococcaceae bacterium]|nr:DUF11 domain-containing protein [Oscillospiraceae bacterium]